MLTTQQSNGTIGGGDRSFLEISGLLHKKRGGFGKMWSNAWQCRFFTISRDGLLCYFDTDSLIELGVTNRGDFDSSKARGKLDLKSVQFDLISDQAIEGAPSTFGIQLSFPNSTEERWRLCADTKEDHSRWCKVLDKYSQIMKSSQRTSSYITSPEEYQPVTALPVSSTNSLSRKMSSNSVAGMETASIEFPAPVTRNPSTKLTTQTSIKGKKRLRLGPKAAMIDPDLAELLLVLVLLNFCAYHACTAQSPLRTLFFVAVMNAVVLRTLYLRAERAKCAAAKLEEQLNNTTALLEQQQPAQDQQLRQQASSRLSIPSLSEDPPERPVASGKPIPGFTFTRVDTDPRLSPPHTWCKVDPRQFNVRVGPDYNRFKRKAPSGQAIYEPFAVDVFCTKERVDHAASRFQLPDTSHIDTHSKWVPPIFVIQIQIPSEPPSSLFSTAQDGPGWAIVMYYRITEEACNELRDLSTASPAVKLFAEWCEKAPVDAEWRGRFKVINSCTNLEQLGMPAVIVSYNAKPVLIRRTGSIFRGPENKYMEMDIHVHKFANLAKQSIYLISSRCGLMFMQIGFVIEGRKETELPETLFACVAVNQPQEDQAEFIFDE
mmetsp:Transcript_9107/g.13579  ORF Transcript_9107/g.13579 Transcript_9107/m.13579 type:complete len:603 (+) Transcript_9107:42-1850(+)